MKFSVLRQYWGRSWALITRAAVIFAMITDAEPSAHGGTAAPGTDRRGKVLGEDRSRQPMIGAAVHDRCR
jgi:hypothetical protein